MKNDIEDCVLNKMFLIRVPIFNVYRFYSLWYRKREKINEKNRQNLDQGKRQDHFIISCKSFHDILFVVARFTRITCVKRDRNIRFDSFARTYVCDVRYIREAAISSCLLQTIYNLKLTNPTWKHFKTCSIALKLHVYVFDTYCLSTPHRWKVLQTYVSWISNRINAWYLAILIKL